MVNQLRSLFQTAMLPHENDIPPLLQKHCPKKKINQQETTSYHNSITVS